MSKELDRLEHLRLGIQYINQDKSPAYISQYEEDINIIETVLLQLESIRNNYCVCEKDAIKKLRALEIIKKNLKLHISVDDSDDDIPYGCVYIKTSNDDMCVIGYIEGKEKIDLLKEILK